MKYKIFWKLTDEFIDLCTKNGNKDINKTSDYEFEKDDGKDFFMEMGKLIEICRSYYPDGDIYLSDYEDTYYGHIYFMVNGKKINSVEYKIRLMPFYAVQSDDYTDWDDGTYDLSEAIDMARDRIIDGQTGVQIAVINEKNNFCVNALIYNEEFDRFDWINPNDIDFVEYNF